MKSRKKFIFRVLIFLLGLIFLSKLDFRVLASSKEIENGKIQYIYNQKEFLSGEEVELTINLTNISKVSEIDLRIEIDDETLEPVNVNNRYFSFTALSIFEKEDIINNYYDNILWLKLTKTHNIKEDYIINNKNNVGTVKFITLKKINNIEEYLNDDKIVINLFDANRNQIIVTSNYSERINYNWSLNNNSIVVNSENLSLYDYISVNNRIASEYSLTISDNINYKRVGVYEIKIYIFDLINEDVINETIRINVVDVEAPTLIKQPSSDTIVIDDSGLEKLNLSNYFEFSDNYDKSVILKYEYFSINDEKMASFEQFINYLSKTPSGKFSIWAVDSSGNCSEKLSYKIEINDTIAPVMMCTEEIQITVQDTLNLDDYISITDNYDIAPFYSTTYFFLDGKECFDIENAIIKGKSLLIKVIAFDKSGNSSKEKNIKLNVIDNVEPEIIIKSLEVEDHFVKSFNYLNHFDFKDNVSDNLIITFIFNAENQVNNCVSDSDINNAFKKMLSENIDVPFSVQVKDEAGNAILVENKLFHVLDVTAPEIVVNNIKNGNTYSEIESIDYKITDNYSNNLDVKIFVNSEPYNGYLELKEGNNILNIQATDEFGNFNELTIEFIIKPQTEDKDDNKIINNNKFAENIKTETICLIVIMGISILIVIYRAILINYKFKRKIHK